MRNSNTKKISVNKIKTLLFAACMLAAMVSNLFNALVIAGTGSGEDGGGPAGDGITTAELEYRFVEVDDYNEYEGYQITGVKEEFIASLKPDSKIRISIPAYYDDRLDGGAYGKYPVVSVGAAAMYELSCPEVPFTVVTIDFSGASNLKEIKGSAFTYLAPFIDASFEVLDFSACKNLSFIGFGAFMGFDTLKEIRLNRAAGNDGASDSGSGDDGDSELTIQANVFADCTSLTAVYLDYVGSFVIGFDNCPNLKLFIMNDNAGYMAACARLPEIEQAYWFAEDVPDRINEIRGMLTYPQEVSFYLNSYFGSPVLTCQKLTYQSIKYVKSDEDGIWFFDKDFRLPRSKNERTLTEWYAYGRDMEADDFTVGLNRYLGYTSEVSGIKGVARSDESLFFTSTTLDSLKEHFEIWPDFGWSEGFVKCDLITFYYSDYDLTLENGAKTLSAGENKVTVTFWDLQCEFTVYAEDVALETISATFDQCGTTVKEGDGLDSLRNMITVTGVNNDGSDYGFITDYRLSGELTEGVCEITVSFGEKTDIICVTVVKTGGYGTPGNPDNPDTWKWYYTLIIILFSLVLCAAGISAYIMYRKETARLSAAETEETAGDFNACLPGQPGAADGCPVSAQENYLSPGEVEAVRLILRDKESNGQHSGNGAAPALPENLTLREREVAELLLAGKKCKEIAAKLFISGTTVKKHIQSILHKSDCIDQLSFIIKYCGNKPQP